MTTVRAHPRKGTRGVRRHLRLTRVRRIDPFHYSVVLDREHGLLLGPHGEVLGEAVGVEHPGPTIVETQPGFAQFTAPCGRNKRVSRASWRSPAGHEWL